MMKHKKIRWIILRACYTQADFAAQLKVAPHIISDVLHGRKKLKSHVADKWAEILDCPIEELREVINYGK